MKIAYIKALIKKGESDKVEFKSSTGGLHAGMQTICAFLNSDHGGTVVFGVNDDGKIIGQQVTDKTRKEIATEINKIEPHVKIAVNYVLVEGERYIIVMMVDPGEKAPYTYDGRAYIRNQTTTMRMSKEEYIYLHNQNNPTNWEILTSNDCKVGDLDQHRIKEVAKIAVAKRRLPESAATASISDILKKLKLIIDNKLTNAAVVLFCKKEQKQFMQSTLKVARFKGIDKKEFLDTKTFTTNAFDLYDKAIDFLDFNLPVAARIEPGNPIRIEEPTIPYNVLREAVTNALVHRDYSNPGGSIAIAIYDDRVNISNTGALPKGVQLNQLSKEHQSIQRNPLIAHVFYICGKIEKWGRGTIDMIEECKKVGNPLPKYEEIGGGFSVTLPFKEPIRVIMNQETPHVKEDTLTQRQKKILAALSMAPLTRTQLMKKLRTKVTGGTIQHELRQLMHRGLITSDGKVRNTLWSIAKTTM